jgi:hypothetical protein
MARSRTAVCAQSYAWNIDPVSPYDQASQPSYPRDYLEPRIRAEANPQEYLEEYSSLLISWIAVTSKRRMSGQGWTMVITLRVSGWTQFHHEDKCRLKFTRWILRWFFLKQVEFSFDQRLSSSGRRNSLCWVHHNQGPGSTTTQGIGSAARYRMTV